MVTFAVNTFDDENDGVSIGALSLREAVIASNTNADASDVIELGAGTFTLTIPGADEDDAATGDLDIAGNVTIQGAGADATVIDANDIDRVLEVLETGTLTLEGVTITGGRINSNDRGGGILNDGGTLTVSNSAISGNNKPESGSFYVYGIGGGIYNDGGTLTVSNSTVSDNSAGFGGGINNSAEGTLKVNNSTISRNGSSGYSGGGGIANDGTASISNSTISGNGSPGDGGGIFNRGTVNISNSTISGNSTIEDVGGIANFGTTTLVSTIVGDNSGYYSPGDLSSSLSGTINASNSLIENDADQINGIDVNNIIGVSPQLDLAGLQDNGGPTQTVALLPTSPAVDAGSNPDGLIADQRGELRIVDGDGDGTSAIDIGAFELPTPPPPPPISTLTVNSTADNLTAGDGLVTLREAIIAANADTVTDLGETGAAATFIQLPVGTFAFALNGDGEDLAATGDLDITSDVTIQGAGADVTIVDANELDRVFQVLETGKLTLEGVTVTGGQVESRGGGIFNDGGSLTVKNSVISGNSSGSGIFNNSSSSGLASLTVTDSIISGNDGGGIFNRGTVSVANSTISGNSTNIGGGGIHNGGTASIAASTISGNTARIGGGVYNDGLINIADSITSNNTAALSGGGIYNEVGTANIIGSTISGNFASYGGGVYNRYYSYSTFETISIKDSTISDNSASNDGGGIFNYSTIAVENSTISGNFAGSNGGGFFNAYLSSIESTIIGNNTASQYSNLRNSDGTVDVSNSLIESDADQITGINVDNIASVDPQLDPAGLQNNGGPTQTIALLPTSPAIDTGSNPDDLSTDQRGIPRSIDGNADGTATPDIGAFEFFPENQVQLDESGNLSISGSASKDTLTLTEVGVNLQVANAKRPLLAGNGTTQLTSRTVTIPLTSITGSLSVTVLADTDRVRATMLARSLVIEGSTGSDRLLAGTKDDILTGGDGDDSLHGNAGHDSLSGQLGHDTLKGGDGDDTLSGGEGNDILYGEWWDAELNATGDDEIDGDFGDDRLFGRKGNDTLRGGEGNDILAGDEGDDVLIGIGDINLGRDSIDRLTGG
ncbi:MAG: choice-of-anchor Q domain-containing protein, partial [Cyanobacteria bacterium P01_F01_bin.33]